MIRVHALATGLIVAMLPFCVQAETALAPGAALPATGLDLVGRAQDLSNSRVNGALLGNLQAGVGINLLDYTGDPDAAVSGRVDTTAAFSAFWTACKAGGNTVGGRNCTIPPGQYRVEGDLVFDFCGNQSGGPRVSGGGQNATRLRFASGKQLAIVNSCTNGTFYASFQGFGIEGNNSTGAVLRIGADDFSDAMNGFRFADLYVKNVASTAGSQGLRLNQVYSSTFDNVTTSDGCRDDYGNCPGGGDSLLLRQSAFNTFQGSFSGARTGVHLSEGYNFGNVFLNNDLEVNYVDVAIDNDQSRFNTWIGGQFQAGSPDGSVGKMIEATAGMSNVFLNPNFSGPNVVGSAVGAVIKGSYNLVSTPAFPTSGETVANGTGRDLLIEIYETTGAVVICHGHAAGTCITQSASSSVATIPVRNGERIKLVYTGRPGAWVWNELN